MALSQRELKEILSMLAYEQGQMEKLADTLEDDILKAFRRGQAYTFRRMRAIISEAPDWKTLTQSDRLNWWVQNKKSIDEALLSSGYGEAVNSYIDQLPKFSQLTAKMLKAQKLQFGGLPPELIKHIQGITRERFMELGAAANTEVSNLFFQSVITGKYKAGALATLKGKITGTYKWGKGKGMYEWHATTYARTSHITAAREFQAAQANELNLERFMGIGPLDSLTRPFCVKHVGKVYTREEIDQMDNGSTRSDVFVDFGGWNCRHSWPPVTKEVADAINANPETAQDAVRQGRAGIRTFSSKDVEGWDKATTIAEAEEWARSKNLADVVGYSGMHISAANEVNRHMAVLLREFPDARRKMGFLGSQIDANIYRDVRGFVPLNMPPGNYAGAFSGGGGGVAFRTADFASREAIREMLRRAQDGISRGWFTPGKASIRRLVYHEFGHVMDFTKNIRTSKPFLDIILEMRKVGRIEKLLCEYSEYEKAAFAWYRGFPEIPSESLVEYLINDAPREYARRIGEEMLRRFKAVKS